ncbi:hypothetical protein REPUB_Repub04eG0171400 [Reevesia pubescens]
MAMLMKRFANLAKTTTKPAPPFSSKILAFPSCFTHGSLSSTSAKTATDVVDISGADDLVYSDPPVSTTVKPLLPNILQPRVVIYDGVCHLCHRGVKWVIKADKYRKIKFCCIQSKTAEPYLRVCGVDREDVLRRFVFIEGLGVYHQGSTGYFSHPLFPSSIYCFYSVGLSWKLVFNAFSYVLWCCFSCLLYAI